MTLQSTTQQQVIADALETIVERTGCMELHHKVQECIAGTQDWRKCQKEVQKLRTCMDEYERKKAKARLNT